MVKLHANEYIYSVIYIYITCAFPAVNGDLVYLLIHNLKHETTIMLKSYKPYILYSVDSVWIYKYIYIYINYTY